MLGILLLLLIILIPILGYLLLIACIMNFAHRHPRWRPFIMGFMASRFPEAVAIYYAEMLVEKDNRKKVNYVSKLELKQINNIIQTQRSTPPNRKGLR